MPRSPFRSLALGVLLIVCTHGTIANAQSSSKPEIVPQLPHSDWVNSVAFSPDGKQLLTGSEDNTLKLWDAGTGLLLRTFGGHTGTARSVSFVPGGKQILSGSGDRLKLWDAVSGRLLRTFEGHSDFVSSIAVSPDGTRVLSGGADNAAKLWDLSTGKELLTLKHDHPVYVVAFSPDGKRVLTLSDKVNIWETVSGKLLRSFGAVEAIQAALMTDSIAFSPDNVQVVMLVSRGEKLVFWDSNTGQMLRQIDLDSEGVAIGISRDGSRVLTELNDGVGLWDFTSGKLLRTFDNPHKRRINCFAFSPDGLRVASVAQDRDSENEATDFFKVWEVETGRVLLNFEANSLPVQSVAVSPDGNQLLSGGDDKGLKRWEMSSGRLRNVFKRHTKTVSSVAFSPDGSKAFSGSWDETAKSWNLSTGELLRTFEGHAHAVLSVAVSPDGARLLVGGGDIFDSGQKMEMWDANTGSLVHAFDKGSQTGDRIEFSPDGRQFASVALNRQTIDLWDVTKAAIVRTFTVPNPSAVVSAAFSPDGKQLMSSSSDNAMRLWDSESGNPPRIFNGPSDATTWSLAYSPRGDRIVSGDDAGLVKIWDVGTGKILRTLQGHSDLVTSVKFSPDGRRIISSSKDATIRIWNADNGDVLAILISSSDDEWVAITPEGFFDASANGAKLLHVVRGLDTFGIDQVYQSLFRPDLVREKLAGDPKSKVKEAALKLDLDKVLKSGRAPVIKIRFDRDAVAKDEKIAIEADIEDQGGGIGRIEWRVNGVTLGLESRGLSPVSVPDNNPAGSARRIRRDVWLEPGKNEIEAVAYNAQNLIASTPAAASIQWEGEGARNKPRLFVLAVGINDYWDSRLRLAYAGADAKALSEAFGEAGKGLYESVTVVPPILDKQVTRDRLETVFNELAEKVRPRDVFVFFLAGHGKTIEGHYYFIPYDFRYENENSIVEKAIGQNQWQAWFAKILARKSILIYDTCESGSLTSDGAATRSLDKLVEQSAAVERLVRATGRTTLAATTDEGPAREGYRGHGVFTYSVLEALERADVNRDGFIEVTSLISYVDRQVPEISQQAFHYRQIPQTKFSGSNFPLAKPVSGLVAAPDAAIPTKPSHVIVRSMEIYTKPSDASEVVRKIEPGTSVALIRTEQGWVLIAKDGKALGYVAESGIAPLQ